MENFYVPLISIIVSIYQVEDYLPQCIDSILSQSFRHFELILVDDGSYDGCPGICDAYAANDNRIKVIHKENGGLSDARNAGIIVSSGTYLLFIDGDDFIASHSLIWMKHALISDEFPDVLFLYSQMFFEDGWISPNGSAFKREDFYGSEKERVLHLLSSGLQFHVSACLKAVKRKFIIQNKIFFTKGLIGEDVDYSINLYLNARTFSCLNFPYYCYRQERAGSIMTQKSGPRFRDLLFIIQKWTLLADGSYREYKNWILRFLFHQYFVLIILYHKISKDLKTKQTKDELKRFSYLLRYTDNKKVFLLFNFYRIFGLDITSYFLNLAESKPQRLFGRTQNND